MDDEERAAISALRTGDIGGLASLVRLHQIPALRATYALTGDRQLAEDLVADAFLTAYDRIAQYDPQRPFGPWFYRIVVNSALKAIRRVERFRHTDTGALFAEQVDPTPDPAIEVATREMRRGVVRALRTLPPPQRAALILRYYLDLDERTIAQTLGCPIGTVKWRLHAGKERIRQSLAGTPDRTWAQYLTGDIP